MNKQELIKHLAEQAGTTGKIADAVLKALTVAVQDTVRTGGELSIPDLGKFSTAQRAARTGHNPKTGEPVQIAAKRAPKFAPAKALKDAATA